jgi:hypothetical protein
MDEDDPDDRPLTWREAKQLFGEILIEMRTLCRPFEVRWRTLLERLDELSAGLPPPAARAAAQAAQAAEAAEAAALPLPALSPAEERAVQAILERGNRRTPAKQLAVALGERSADRLYTLLHNLTLRRPPVLDSDHAGYQVVGALARRAGFG